MPKQTKTGGDRVYRVSVIHRETGRSATGFPRLCSRKSTVTQIRNARQADRWLVTVDVARVTWVPEADFDTAAPAARAGDDSTASRDGIRALLGNALGDV